MVSGVVEGAAAKHHVPGPSAASFAYNTTGSIHVESAPSSVSGPATLQFQGVTNGVYTVAQGQSIQLGQFVVPASTNTYGSPTTFTNTPFELQVTAPEFNKTTTVPLLDKVFPTLGKSFHLKTETDNSLLIRGVLNGTVSASGQANLAATVGSIKLGGINATTTDHITRYTFPIRFSQLRLPSSWTESSPLAVNVPLPTPTTPTQTYASTAAAKVQAAPAAEMLLAATSSKASGTVQPASAAATITPTPIAIPVPVPTPEPSTIAILGLGLGGLWVARRRRRCPR